MPDAVRFPALRLARTALATGGHAPIVLNAANEAAVAAFLARRIGFLDIARVVEDVIDGTRELDAPVDGLQQVQAADLEARSKAEAACQNYSLSN
jgi:1-deoxy-D-xylulose-5-phosphate reductoisomerase